MEIVGCQSGCRVIQLNTQPDARDGRYSEELPLELGGTGRLAAGHTPGDLVLGGGLEPPCG